MRTAQFVLCVLCIFFFAYAAYAYGAGDEELDLARAFILRAAKAGCTKTLMYNPSGLPSGARIAAADDANLTIVQNGTSLSLSWKQLKPPEVYFLAKGLLAEGQVDEHLLVARLALKLNLGEDMDKPLERLEIDAPQEVARIEAVRALFKPALAAIVPTVHAAPTAPASATRPRIPPFNKPLMYDTPEADAVLAATQILPPDHPFNQEITSLPVLANSERMISKIGPDTVLWPEQDMNYVVVPPNQKMVDVKITPYGVNESDKGPFPVPDCTPIEEWPIAYPGVSLAQIQRKGEGDRHMFVVDPGNGKLYEFFMARLTDTGWEVGQASIFDLNALKFRPLGWTSSDAAGMPVFPAVVKYWECERGMVEHAMRFAVKHTRKEYVYPARHHASSLTDPDLPRMGERFRLRADFDISGFAPHVQAILKGLKKYGMLTSDNTGNLSASLSIAPDSRIKGLDSLKKLTFKNFEVVQMPVVAQPKP